MLSTCSQRGLRHISVFRMHAPRATYSTRIPTISPISRIQHLYDTLSCITDVHISAANPDHCPFLNKCLAIMNDVTLSEVGLDGYDLSSIEDSVCMSICSTRDFEIALFIVPVGLALPLHDHPDMAVLSKLIRGEVLCTSFTPLHALTPSLSAGGPPTSSQQHQHPDQVNNADLASDSAAPPLAGGPFYLREVQVKTAQSAAWFLSPGHGNLHAIHALSPTPTLEQGSLSSPSPSGSGQGDPAIMLDILLPPYNSSTRPCKYYSATSHPLWIPTIPVGRARSCSDDEGDGGGSGHGEVNNCAENEDVAVTIGRVTTMRGAGAGAEIASEEWRWKKWVVQEVEEPTEALPYGVQYSGDVPVPS